MLLFPFGKSKNCFGIFDGRVKTLPYRVCTLNNILSE